MKPAPAIMLVVLGAATTGWLLEFLTATGPACAIDRNDVIAVVTEVLTWLPERLVSLAELLGMLGKLGIL